MLTCITSSLPTNESVSTPGMGKMTRDMTVKARVVVALVVKQIGANIRRIVHFMIQA